MKILINDYCGHPFQFSLSIELATLGHHVLHIFTSASGGPKSVSCKKITKLEIVDIDIPKIAKQSFVSRFFQESKYGMMTIKEIKRFSPNIVLSANTPLVAQRQISNYCKNNNIKFVFWLQDIISIAAKSILTQKLGLLGKIIGAIFKSIERDILQRSDHIITISDDFVDIINEWGLNGERTTVIPNWAPIEQIPVLPKVNSFSQKHQIDNKFIVLYSGTMGMKHNPHIISKAAKNLQANSDIIFVVITDDIGMAVLKREKVSLNLDNLLLLPFQPFESFSQVLASADVLLTLLEEDAGVFSVPSKVWSGYCACRPAVLVMPEENIAAKKTKEINAGVVIPNEQSSKLSEIILNLKNNPHLCNIYGKNARNYAEQNFRIDNIAQRFEKIVNNLSV